MIRNGRDARRNVSTVNLGTVYTSRWQCCNHIDDLGGSIDFLHPVLVSLLIVLDFGRLLSGI